MACRPIWHVACCVLPDLPFNYESRGSYAMRAFLECRTVLLFALCAANFFAGRPPCFGAVSEVMTLEQALDTALDHNPEIASTQALAQAEHSLVRSQAWPGNPRIGYMREHDLNFMEQEMGTMNFWTVSQEVAFPPKYALLGKAQLYKASAADQEASAKRLEIRRQVIGAYYNLYTTHRIIDLYEALRETLLQVARSAESRYAAGSAPQQDEMKAHVEQTKLESDLIIAKKELRAMEASLNAMLDRRADTPIVLAKGDLPVPKVTISFEELPSLANQHARALKRAEFRVSEAQERRSLAKLSYAPDFSFSFRKAFTGAPSDNYAFGVELTIPLWFFMKQTSEIASVSAQALSAEREQEKAVRSVDSNLSSLVIKVKTQADLLRIFSSSLIPQTTTTLNSSRSAYQAGRISLLEYLDSVRSLYTVRISYYQTLSQYAENLSELEELVGASLSSLPFNGDLL